MLISPTSKLASPNKTIDILVERESNTMKDRGRREAAHEHELRATNEEAAMDEARKRTRSDKERASMDGE